LRTHSPLRRGLPRTPRGTLRRHTEHSCRLTLDDQDSALRRAPRRTPPVRERTGARRSSRFPPALCSPPLGAQRGAETESVGDVSAQRTRWCAPAALAKAQHTLAARPEHQEPREHGGGGAVSDRPAARVGRRGTRRCYRVGVSRASSVCVFGAFLTRS
jgi:hypothetical protein